MCLQEQLSHHPVLAENQEARTWIILRASVSYLTNISKGGIPTTVTRIVFINPKLTGTALYSHTGYLLWNSPFYLFFDCLQSNKFLCVFYATFRFLFSSSCFFSPLCPILSLLKPSYLDYCSSTFIRSAFCYPSSHKTCLPLSLSSLFDSKSTLHLKRN